MIAVDTSTLIAYFQGDEGSDVDRLDAALGAGEVVLPPVVLTETLSEPKLPPSYGELLASLPILDLRTDFWCRAAATRAMLWSIPLRARLADTLIAQSCIDHGIRLITRDDDFRHFAKHCGLALE